MAVRIESQAEPIPGYKLIERLGGGGFGEVWKAVAPGGLLKAIKFVYGDLQEAGEDGHRAEQELKALSRVKTVRHPYVLSLERFDIVDGQLMIVMELADRNLWDRFKECRSQGLPGIPREELLGYMEEAAEALDLMNIQYQLQHLDIKPQNLFLVHNHIKVADFGLVKDLEGMVASVTGGVTPVYAAPETFDGWVSRFSDQYSLAIVYQELLTAARPFNATHVRQLILQHLQKPPDLSSLPPTDRPIVGRALAKNPEERFPNCRELIQALRGPRVVRVEEDGAKPDAAAGGEPKVDETALQHSDTPVAREGVDGREGPPVGELPPSEPFQPQATWWIRPHDDGRKPELAPVSTPAPPPAHGDGVLFPALVISIGQLGLGVLQRLRESLVARFDTLDALPSLRLLCIDTDPAVLRTATRGTSGSALTAGEILLTRLNRPSHYLRSRDGRGLLESWFDLQMLYRIPRGLETKGMRALGRLAFQDNYAAVVRRLHQEIAECTNADHLLAAAKQSGLGLRSNRPRVYVVTSLMGGTGGGMFLDLAYVLRHILKEIGYGQPDLVGVFLLPSVDPRPAAVVPLGNTLAALTEWHHFSSPGVNFSARYQERSPSVKDADAPFGRCFLLQLPPAGDAEGSAEVVGRAAEFLRHDLTEPLGRQADLARSAQPSSARSAKEPLCQTFGMARVSFPKRALVREMARQVCRRLVDRWVTKDSKPLREPVRAWVEQQWADQDLGAEAFIDRLRQSCEKLLGQPVEAALAAVVSDQTAVPTPEAGREVLLQLEQLVGKPEEEGMAPFPSAVGDALGQATTKLVGDMGQKVASLIVCLIEQPEYRLAGAEEAIRQMVACLEKVLEHHDPLAKELETRSRDAHARINALLDTFQKNQAQGRRGPPNLANDLAELLRLYPKWRYQGLMLQQLARAYVSLRGNLSDQAREVNFCRARLGELLRSFADGGPSPDKQDGPHEGEAAAPAPAASAGPSRVLYPAGCASLDEATAELLEGLTADDLLAVENQVQDLIRKQFTALVHVCLSSTNHLKNLEVAMQQQVEDLVGGRLEGINVAELFLGQFARDGEAQGELVSAFDEAAPDLASMRFGPQPGFCILATPGGAAGDRVRDLARRGLTAGELLCIPSAADILFYRETAAPPLAELEQFGPTAQQAYRQMCAVEHFTPHTRIDIKQWQPVTAAPQLVGGRA